MREAVIVSTARTPIGKAVRGAFNNIKSPSLAAHAIRRAVSRAQLDPAEIDDLVLGCVLTAGTQGLNVARLAALAADLPVSVPAQTIDRQCSSGLMAVAIAAKQIIVDGMNVVVAGGVENISALNAPYFEWASRERDAAVLANQPNAYMSMLGRILYDTRWHCEFRETSNPNAVLPQLLRAFTARKHGYRMARPRQVRTQDRTDCSRPQYGEGDRHARVYVSRRSCRARAAEGISANIGYQESYWPACLSEECHACALARTKSVKLVGSHPVTSLTVVVVRFSAP
jgi:hypothetical protein